MSKEAFVNKRIRAKEVLVIDEEGEQLGVFSTFDAVRMAEEKGLDLVEVASKANPPVCKFMDYGAFKYKQKKAAREAQKKATRIQVKEVQLRPKIDDHDVQFKVKNIRRFLAQGDKAKVSVKFRGREIAHKDQGFKLLNRVISIINDPEQPEQAIDFVVESPPKMEGKTMIAVLAPNKK